jgi:hypothetical protein
MKKLFLLLTSTIKPNPSQPALNLVDPYDRIKDYQAALAFYMTFLEKGIIDHIIYVDNSGFDLGIFIDKFKSDHVEWISFYGLDYPSHYHRGYGEFKLIDYAFSHSKILLEMGNADVVYKITGRYIIKNLSTFIRMAPKQFEVYCEIKNNWTELSIIAWSRLGYEKYLQGIYEKFNTEKVPELILCEFLKNKIKTNSGIIIKYYWQPYIIGRRGSDGSSFQGRLTSIRTILSNINNTLLLPYRIIRDV